MNLEQEQNKTHNDNQLSPTVTRTKSPPTPDMPSPFTLKRAEPPYDMPSVTTSNDKLSSPDTPNPYPHKVPTWYWRLRFFQGNSKILTANFSFLQPTEEQTQE